MTRLLPEKTVEIWTGIAVAASLPAAELWSPASFYGSIDQLIRAGKTWAFELKSMDDGPPPGITIDLSQLERHAFSPPLAVPVFYVLPVVPWQSLPSLNAAPPAEAAQWGAFPEWAWVVPAIELAAFCQVTQGHCPAGSRKINPLAPGPWPLPTVSLAAFLNLIGGCLEPREWNIRHAEDSWAGRPPIQEDIRESMTNGSSYFVVHVPAAALPGQP